MREAFAPGTPVVVYLHTPREKVFGLIAALEPAGVAVCGIDLAAFDDWVRQEARGDEPGLGLVTLFFPMNRVERIERDETMGSVESFSDRFRRQTGRSVAEAAGFDALAARGPGRVEEGRPASAPLRAGSRRRLSTRRKPR